MIDSMVRWWRAHHSVRTILTCRSTPARPRGRDHARGNRAWSSRSRMSPCGHGACPTRPALYTACQDPDIGRWVSIPQPFTLSDAEAQIAEWRSMWRDGSGAPFAIVDPDSEQLLGAVVRIGPDGHQATLGCWVARDARGRGIGTRALRRVAEWTFDTTDVVRVDAYIMVGNASLRADDRAGRLQARGRPAVLGPAARNPGRSRGLLPATDGRR